MDERAIWSLRIKEAQSRDELIMIEDALPATGEAWIGPLRIMIGVYKARLKREHTQAQLHIQTQGFAQSYGLPAPDARWLYQYRLAEEAFDRLQRDLAKRTAADLTAGYWPGLFVLWASEWFRRVYGGGGQQWSDLCDVLGIVEDQPRLRSIAESGLKMWQRPIQKAATAREFLGSLAREGGFPAAAIEEGGRGWAQEVLKAIVGPLLGEIGAGEDRARELAALQLARLPQLFRDDDFIALCADLALAVVALRREADAAAAAVDLPVVAWLELHRPGWRERLPVSTGDRTANALIDGLMKVEVVHGASIGVERLLQCDGRGWHEAVRLTLDGVLDTVATQQLDPAHGRLRVFAAGEMARALPGEIAMFEAPAEGSSQWSARSTRRARGVQPLPFAAAIELDLRSGEQRVARIALAGGKPRRGALIVTVPEGVEDNGPKLLRVVGSGSGKYRADALVVQIPNDWRADATLDESVTLLGPGVGETSLWRVTGGAFITDASGDRFRVLCGQQQDEIHRIDLIGTSVHWADVAGDVDLYKGPPIARIGGNGSLCLRSIGTRRWEVAPRTLPIGHYELGWRRDGVVLDRRRIAVLPASAEVIRQGSPRDASYRLSGFGVCSISPAENAPVRVSSEGHWQARPTSQRVHWFEAQINWPEGPPLSVRINYPCPASIAGWDGFVLPNQARITLAELSGLVAVNDGRVQMVGELVSNGRRLGEMTWEVIDELPMASVAGDLASLLLPASIDAEVRLGMHDGIETWWRLRQFSIDLKRDAGGGLVASSGVAAEGVQLVGRSLSRPSEEISFGAYSLLTDANHRPAMLPPLDGDWLVYLRAEESILSRPLFQRGEQPAVPHGMLGQAMTNSPGPLLDRALLDLLALAQAENGSAPIIQELLELICSLRGLPPTTFRVLELLPQRLGVLARLAMSATAESRVAVLALSDALPFAWCTIPRYHWQAAQGEVFTHLIKQLEVLGPAAPIAAKDSIDLTIARLIEGEPLLAPVFGPSLTEPIETIAQSFLNRAVDRIPRNGGSRYRDRLPDALPTYFLRFDPGVIDTIDAPCAAAAAVAELWSPTLDDIRHIKTVARNFPTFFVDAFAARLQEYS